MRSPPTMSLALIVATTPCAEAADPQDGLFDLDDLRVKITETLPHFEARHEGRLMRVLRHQEPGHTVVPPFDHTARDCPPYCIQPMKLAPGVETIGELELIDYLQRAAKDEPILVIDSRTEPWISHGMIPGATPIPYTRLDPAHAEPEAIADLLEFELGAIRMDGLWSFGAVKTLVFYCNGPWCGQSPSNIRALLQIGYPPDRIKWYRGGMQMWEQLGFTTVKPSGAVAE
ncbi:MAG: rhodanese-like domain-containing protein [Thiocapsa sp.]|nr:rhodanese-like domain-containing protein [Thiocapsa sp.]MCG6896820.1 rhodanese-like domain-containing protein [Thiocapsa sp.]MCG6984096.1 rhodanese-like domain-containing protein [Thiocapsa sp.]